VNFTRRRFLKASALAGFGAALGARRALAAPDGALVGAHPAPGAPASIGAPDVLTRSKVPARTAAGTLAFRSYTVQRGRGPHLLDWAYASDESWDAFHSNITAGPDGVRISDAEGREKFGVNVRWNVEGFGYTFLTADNAGEFYSLPPEGATDELNLPWEIARSRVARNRTRMRAHAGGGWMPSRELRALTDLSEELMEDAGRAHGDEERRAALSQRALLQAIRAGELLELEYARHEIAQRGYRGDFYFGCDARGFYEMHQDKFLDLFSALFNFATITFVPVTNREIEDFEPQEGRHQYEMRDLLLERLHGRGITVEGRLLFWFHHWVTPDWMKKKSYPELLKYVEKTTREVLKHYGDRMYAWEMVNEIHDWANECALTPEQVVGLTKLACDVARDTAPHVHRMVNNCCPFAEYVQLKKWSGQDALYPQRTPVQFTKDLVDAGVDFTIIGQQLYYPYRDIQDTLLLVERYEKMGKRIQISEMGASSGPTDTSVALKKVGMPGEPYAWHRPWDEELQADWMEAMYTLAYSRPSIEGAHWFDFVDPYYFIDNGGLLRSPEGETKAAYDRFRRLRESWSAMKDRGRRHD